MNVKNLRQLSSRRSLVFLVFLGFSTNRTYTSHARHTCAQIATIVTHGATGANLIYVCCFLFIFSYKSYVCEFHAANPWAVGNHYNTCGTSTVPQVHTPQHTHNCMRCKACVTIFSLSHICFFF